MKKLDKIYVAGHTGMIGSALVRALINRGYSNLILKTHDELDLTNQKSVEDFFLAEKPDVVFLVAANVGGIADNREYPAEHLVDNAYIALNVVSSAYRVNCKHLLFISSNCIYPVSAKLPLCEDSFMTGKLDPDWEGYGLSKMIGVKLCEYYSREYGVQYISAVPCNLYGINDCYNPQKSRVVAALIQRFHDAKIKGIETVEIWGDGSALREFLFSEDVADACIFLINNYFENKMINVSSGIENSIKDIAYKIGDIVGYQGKIVFNDSKPGGIPRKNMSCDKINKLGWYAKYDLSIGLEMAYEWFKNNIHD